MFARIKAMKKMILTGTLALVLTLVVTFTTSVFFIFSMMLALNGFTSGANAFLAFIIALPVKSLALSLSSLWTVVLLSETRFFRSIIVSVLLVLLAVVIFSIINLVVDVFGAFVMLGIAESSRPHRL